VAFSGVFAKALVRDAKSPAWLIYLARLLLFICHCSYITSGGWPVVALGGF